jgi:hypothetical protein
MDHAIFPELGHPEILHDQKTLERILGRRRRSLSSSAFTEEDFQNFRQKCFAAKLEAAVTTSVLPIIVGQTNGIRHEENRLFTNITDLTDGNISKAKPDLYDGAVPKQIHEIARHALGPYISPSKNAGALVLPNFFIEIKGDSNSSRFVLNNQGLYDGALGARALDHARRYANAGLARADLGRYSIVATYDNAKRLLELFVMHTSVNDQSATSPAYYQNQIGAWVITQSREVFVRGVGALRNAREWALQQRDQLVSQINQAALQKTDLN